MYYVFAQAVSMLHALATVSAFVLVIHVAVVNAATLTKGYKGCFDHTPSNVTNLKITGYPDPWSLSLSWTAPSQCVHYYYVFVRNGGILPQGLKDFQPDQIIKTKQTHLAVYKLKSNWKYRVDVVAVNSRRGRSAYATVFGTTPKDLRFSTPAPTPAAKTPPASKPPSPPASVQPPPPLPSAYKHQAHGSTAISKPQNKGQPAAKLPVPSHAPQKNSTKPPSDRSTKSPNLWSAPAKASSAKPPPPPPPSPSPSPAAAAPSPAAAAAQPSPAPTAAGATSACDRSKMLGAPVNVAAVFVGGGRDKVRLTWKAPVLSSCFASSLLGYKLTGVDSLGATILNSPLTASERDVTVTRLNPRTTYIFKVVALNAQGEGTLATIAVNPFIGSVTVTGSAAAMMLYPPPPPSPAAAVAYSPAVQPPSAAQGPTSPAPSTTSPSPQPARAQQVPGSNLTSGVQNSSGCREDLKPAAPQKFTAVAYGTGMIKLQWSSGNMSICADSFQLDGYVLKTGDPVVATLIGYTNYTLTKLDPGTEYAFTVAAVNPKGRGRPATAFVSTAKERR